MRSRAALRSKAARVMVPHRVLDTSCEKACGSGEPAPCRRLPAVPFDCEMKVSRAVGAPASCLLSGAHPL